jgi:hypothetical protein
MIYLAFEKKESKSMIVVDLHCLHQLVCSFLLLSRLNRDLRFASTKMTSDIHRIFAALRQKRSPAKDYIAFVGAALWFRGTW